MQCSVRISTVCAPAKHCRLRRRGPAESDWPWGPRPSFCRHISQLLRKRICQSRRSFQQGTGRIWSFRLSFHWCRGRQDGHSFGPRRRSMLLRKTNSPRWQCTHVTRRRRVLQALPRSAALRAPSSRCACDLSMWMVKFTCRTFYGCSGETCILIIKCIRGTQNLK